jgi:membrane protease YdiL (CAAX protease family)
MKDEADRLAEDLGGFGPVGWLAILAIVLSGIVTIGNVGIPLGGLLVLAWVRLSRTPWREIGYVRPKTWIGAIVIGLAFGVAFKLVMKAVVMPLLGADPINQTYHYLVGNQALLPFAAWTMLAAGFGEETVFRGFLFERLGKLFGSSNAARVAIVLITSLLFGLAHLPDQGVAGMEQAWITGLVFGSIFAYTRSIFMLMWAHAAFDLAAIAIIYLNLENTVAHLVFK